MLFWGCQSYIDGGIANIHAISVEEEEFIISGYPKVVEIITDSTCLLISGSTKDQISEFNYLTGKFIRILDLGNLNADSIIEKYIIPNNPNCTFIPSSSSDFPKVEVPGLKHFYLYRDRNTQNIFLDYQPVVAFYRSKDTSNIIISYASFIIEYDFLSGIKKIIPVAIDFSPDQKESILTDNGFFVNQNNLYVGYDRDKKHSNVPVLVFSDFGYKGKMDFEKSKIYYPDSSEIIQNMFFNLNFSTAGKELFVSNQKEIYNIKGNQLTNGKHLNGRKYSQLQKFWFPDDDTSRLFYHVLYLDTSQNFQNTAEYLMYYDLKKDQAGNPVKIMDVNSFGKVAFFKGKAIVLVKEKENWYFKIYSCEI